MMVPARGPGADLALDFITVEKVPIRGQQFGNLPQEDGRIGLALVLGTGEDTVFVAVTGARIVGREQTKTGKRWVRYVEIPALVSMELDQELMGTEATIEVKFIPFEGFG